MDEPLRVHRALVALPAVAVAIALPIAGWGGVAGAMDGPTSSSAATSSGSIRVTATKPVSTCLKAHGVKLPKGVDFSKNFKRSKNFKPPKNFKPSKNFKAPKGFKPTKESKKLEAALKACGVSGGFFPGGGKFSSGARASALKAYLGCLSSNGVKVPKKDKKNGTLTGLSTQAKFAAANKKCSVLLPTGPPSTATTGS